MKSNKLGVLIALGGIASVGYYFLEKSKPKTTESQERYLKALSDYYSTGAGAVENTALKNIDLSKNMPSTGNRKLDDSYKKVKTDFPLRSNNCVGVDTLIKDLRDKIADEQKKEKFDGNYVNAMKLYKAQIEVVFEEQRCSDKLETLRLKESGTILTKESVSQEKTVLGKANIDQRVYIIGGGIMLLTGLFIVIRK